MDGICTMVERHDASQRLGNDALLVALVGCFNGAKEEVRRHEVEVEMRREWAAKQPRDAELEL